MEKNEELQNEELVAEYFLVFFDEDKNIFEIKGVTEYPSIGVLIYVFKELKEKYENIEDKNMDILSKEQYENIKSIPKEDI